MSDFFFQKFWNLFFKIKKLLKLKKISKVEKKSNFFLYICEKKLFLKIWKNKSFSKIKKKIPIFL